jgi:hypothetical protein
MLEIPDCILHFKLQYKFYILQNLPGLEEDPFKPTSIIILPNLLFCAKEKTPNTPNSNSNLTQ